MDELIKRLEEATGPSRELDAEIAVASGGYFFGDGELCYRDGETIVHPGHGGIDLAPKYTSSIDAALTLVPEGWARESAAWPDGLATVTLEGTHIKEDGDRWHHHSDGRVDAAHRHEAIALCIASVKAIQAQTERETA